MFQKTDSADLALFGGAPLFDTIRSISNLVQPDVERFLAYSKVFHDAGQYTDHGGDRMRIRTPRRAIS